MEEKGLIYETKYWKVFLHENQAYLGYCVPVLKSGSGSMSEITKEEWEDYQINIVQKLELLFKKTFDATMFNWTCLMNNAYKRSPPNPCVHWHCRPRYNHEVNLNGESFKDPNFAHHYDREARNIVSEDVFNNIINELKKNLD